MGLEVFGFGCYGGPGFVVVLESGVSSNCCLYISLNFRKES